MTKYEELALQSIEHSKVFHEVQDRCEHTAWKLAKELSEYLAAPRDAMKFVEVDRDLHIVKALGSVLHSSPKMTYGIDGFWYFAIELFLAVPDTPQYFSRQTSIFGVKQRGTAFVLRHSKDVAIDFERHETVRAFLGEFVGELSRFYSTPVGEKEPRIGFTPPA